MLQGDHNCPCSEETPNPLTERLPPGKCHLHHHEVICAVNQILNHLLTHWTHFSLPTGQIGRLQMPSPTWTRGTHMWECCSLTKNQRSIPSCPWIFLPSSETLGSTPPSMMDPELPDGETPGCADKQHHILHSHSQHRHPPGLCAQSSPVLPVHAWLRGQQQLRHHHQICWWHYRHRPDHWRQWDGLQRGGQSPDILVPGQQPPSQRKQNKGSWLWTTGRDWEKNTSHSPSAGLQCRESAASGSSGFTSVRTCPSITTQTPSQRWPDSSSSSSAGYGGSTWIPGFSATYSGAT